MGRGWRSPSGGKARRKWRPETSPFLPAELLRKTSFGRAFGKEQKLTSWRISLAFRRDPWQIVPFLGYLYFLFPLVGLSQILGQAEIEMKELIYSYVESQVVPRSRLV